MEESNIPVRESNTQGSYIFNHFNAFLRLWIWPPECNSTIEIAGAFDSFITSYRPTVSTQEEV